ncbi:SRPBCC family protein [Agromyces sp. NPDC058136]|uniref:SRPBCC family protein n=1 Tax=Agromyces sp. NPDC058136 TaxID=3346354 RepID=UPI0036D82AE4
MGYRSFTNSRSIETTPDRLWEILLDPSAMSEFADHPVLVEPAGPLQGVVGETWAETHGPECDDDRVQCKLIAVDAQRRLRLSVKQRGVKQTVEYTLTPIDGSRTELQERIVFAPTFAGKPGQHVVSWLLLVTGLLAKFGDDEGESLEALARAATSES